MSHEEISKKAEELARQFNPKSLVPFPFENIIDQHKELDIVFSDDIDPNISGAVLFKDDIFTILINSGKPEVHQNFTIAHELGHFFLHKNEIKKGQGLIDSANVLYYKDNDPCGHLESEADIFAASLIMPEQLVREAWSVSKGVEDSAQLFNVSVVAMSIRLENLGLVT